MSSFFVSFLFDIKASFIDNLLRMLSFTERNYSHFFPSSETWMGHKIITKKKEINCATHSGPRDGSSSAQKKTLRQATAILPLQSLS